MIDVTGLLSNGNLLANGCGPTHKPTNISLVREANCLKVEHRTLILNTRTEYIRLPIISQKLSDVASVRKTHIFWLHIIY
jgi:hypothetical protein